MFAYLLDRDQDDNFRFSRRAVVDGDGRSLSINAYRVVWRWFDHLVAYEYGPNEQEILKTMHKIAERHGVSLDFALGHAVAHHLYELEQMGGDVTDDNLPLIADLRFELGRVHKALSGSAFPD